MSTDVVRKSTMATLTEIVDGERLLAEQGVDVRNPDEWMQLRDIISRIERRLMSKQAAE